MEVKGDPTEARCWWQRPSGLAKAEVDEQFRASPNSFHVRDQRMTTLHETRTRGGLRKRRPGVIVQSAYGS